MLLLGSLANSYRLSCTHAQVTILSEGYQMYTGSPMGALAWFEGMHFHYRPDRDGILSDWLIDLVSVGFCKPASFKVSWYNDNSLIVS